MKGLSDNPRLRFIVYGYGCVLGYAYSEEQARKALWNYHGRINVVDQWK